MSYQVFARKYRPRTFDDVLGQDHVVRTLRNAITQNRLAHAYLFVGPRGTGKTSTARIFAKALNCPDGPRADFNPDDPLCIEIEKGICLDVREIDGASNNGVEQVRELREEVKFAPSRCRYKIYYIDEVHMLSTPAFNALLKTLEEPPEHVKFIFATTEANKVLPTIISRCQRFDLRRIPAALIAKHLLHIASLENVQIEDKAAYSIAKGAEGGMRDAQSMLDQLVAFCGGQIVEQDVLDIFGFTRGETVANLAQRVMERDTVGALRELHSQADAGKDLGRLLADLIQHFRAILVHQVDAAAAEEDASPEVAALMRSQAQLWGAEPLLRVMDDLAEVDARMRWAGNKLLHFEIGLIQAIQTLGEVTLSDVIEAIGQPGISAGAPSPAPRAAPPAVRPAPSPSPSVASTPTPREPARPAPPLNRPEPAPSPAPAPVPATFVPPKQTPPTDLLFAPPDAIRGPVPTGELWAVALQRIKSDRPFAHSWLESGVMHSCANGKLIIGLPSTEDGARDSLLRPLTKKFVESIFSELTGAPITLDVILDSSLQAPPTTEMELTFTPPPKSASSTTAAPEAPAAVAQPQSEFYPDPLIQHALEKLKAKLVN